MLRAWNEREDARWRAQCDEFQRQRIEADTAWWAAYNVYLQSDAWYQLRQLVFESAGGI